MKETTLPAPSTFLNKLEIFICEAETFSFQNLSQCGIAPLWRQTYPLTCNEQSLCHPWEFPFSLSFSEREGVFRQRQGNWSVERGTSWNIEDRFFCGSCVGIRMLMVQERAQLGKLLVCIIAPLKFSIAFCLTVWYSWISQGSFCFYIHVMHMYLCLLLINDCSLTRLNNSTQQLLMHFRF